MSVQQIIHNTDMNSHYKSNNKNQNFVQVYNYHNRYPQQNFDLSPSSNILSAMLQYFSKENVTILFQNIDIFSEEYQRTYNRDNDDNQTSPQNQQQITTEEQQKQSIQVIFNKWINQLNDGQQRLKKSIYNFLEYLDQKVGNKLVYNFMEDQRNNQSQQNQYLSKKQITGNVPNKFNDQQLKYLEKYYRHFCEIKQYLTKGKTFQDIKKIHQTIMLPQWMRFCKQANIIIKNTDLKHNTRHQRLASELTITQLTNIFRKNQGIHKQFIFQQFCVAIKDVITTIQSNNNSGGYSTNKIDAYQVLGLKNEENHYQFMDKLGIKYIRQKVYFYNLSPKSLTNKNKSLSKSLLNKTRGHGNKKKLLIPTQKQNQAKSRHVKNKIFNTSSINPSLNQSISIEPNSTTPSKIGAKKKIKYYKNRQQRRQSELLKKLNITNLNKIKTPNDILCNFEKFGPLNDNDYYLKQYHRKQKQVSSGIMSRMKSNVKKMQKKMR